MPAAALPANAPSDDEDELPKIEAIVGHEACGNHIKMLARLRGDGTNEDDAPVGVMEAEVQDWAPALLAQYWADYNTRRQHEGDAGGWRPSDRLPPYSPRDEERNLHHPMRVRGHKKVKRGASYPWQVQVEWLRWPAQEDWTWENLTVIVRDRFLLTDYINDTLDAAGKPGLEVQWRARGVTMKNQMDEMERRLEESKST
ncbi:hypothetical protein QBC39DRAFT_358820 [Podospora conica]|nr:hypothetical protein QBC39DRAFT_358820 [Schizothecium conicum]